ncbi:MAG: prepilin-type N-terminal cleavage/methylation domain-containing protein [Candidatus Andersenbacteria bacterium]
MPETKGFTLIELLIVIAIIGILSILILIGVIYGREKAHDNAIRSDVVQLRWLAEQVYDSQGASYLNWRAHASIQTEVATIIADIDKQLGEPTADNYPITYPTSYAVTIRESQRKEYCISAPLKSEEDKHYCIDATGVFKVVATVCASQTLSGPPLRCPSS